jgi:uncharacterized membrane protein YhaH (DUF805 family)
LHDIYFPAKMPSFGGCTIFTSLPRRHRSALARYLLPCRDAIVRRLHDIYFPAETPSFGGCTIFTSLPRRHRSATARYLLPCRDAIVRRLHDIYFPAETPSFGGCTIFYSLSRGHCRLAHDAYFSAEISCSNAPPNFQSCTRSSVDIKTKLCVIVLPALRASSSR